MDALTAILQKVEEGNLFQPLALWGIRHRLSVCAEDDVLLINPDVNKAKAVVELLKLFGTATGLTCNMAKNFNLSGPLL